MEGVSAVYGCLEPPPGCRLYTTCDESDDFLDWSQLTEWQVMLLRILLKLIYASGFPNLIYLYVQVCILIKSPTLLNIQAEKNRL